MTTKRASFMWFHKGIKFVLTISPQKFSRKNFNIFMLTAWDLNEKMCSGWLSKSCRFTLVMLHYYLRRPYHLCRQQFHRCFYAYLSNYTKWRSFYLKVTGHSYCSQWHYIAIMGAFITSCRKQLFLLQVRLLRLPFKFHTVLDFTGYVIFVFLCKMPWTLN